MIKTFRAFLAAATAALGLMTAGSALAQTTLDYSTGPLDTAFQMSGSGTGQTFTVPAGVDRLTSVSLGVTQQTGSVQSYTLGLYPITGGTLGAAIQTSAQTITVASQYPTYELDTLTLNGGGLAVTPGQTYAIVASAPSDGAMYVGLQFADSYPGGVYYRGGLSTGDSRFKAVFVNSGPQPVPTMSEWAMILFGLILAGGAALYVQRRRMAV